VGAAVALRDVVSKAIDVFGVAVVPLQGDFDGDAVFVGAAVEDGRVQRGFVAVLVFDEGFDAAFVLEDLVFVVAFVAQFDAHAGVEEGEFAQTLGEGFIVVFDVAEGVGAGEEVDFGAGAVCVAGDGKRRLRLAVAVGLLGGVAGASGGFRLSRPAARVSLDDVVSALGSAAPLFQCNEIRCQGAFVDQKSQILASGLCSINRAMSRAEDAWRASLAGTSIADLAAGLDNATRTRMLQATGLDPDPVKDPL